MSSDHIRVVVRLRPLNSRETALDHCTAFAAASDNKTVLQCGTNGRPAPGLPTYTFDRVYPPDCSNVDVFNDTAREIINSALEGVNGTIFTYGQTSSGKTHTMLGSTADPGIIPLAVREIFAFVHNTPDREFLLRVAYMEIYNEAIRDLLQPANDNLKIHETVTREIFVGNLTEEIVLSETDVMNLMASGEEHRRFGVTNMNDRSSRSHTIFRMIIESRERGSSRPVTGQPSAVALGRSAADTGDGAVRVATLNLVDLAGSERVRHTGAEGLRLKEGGHINKSLLTLATVIGKLTEGNDRVHIPFRDSKLTRILQTSLGGNARTVIVGTITPASGHMDETHSTLKFASRAKEVKNKPQVNEILSDEALLKKYQNEITNLRKQLNEINTGEHGAAAKQQPRQEELIQLENEKQMIEQQNVLIIRQLQEKENQQAILLGKMQKLAKLILNSNDDTSNDFFTEDGLAKAAKKQATKRRKTWFPGMRATKLLDDDAATAADETSTQNEFRETSRKSSSSIRSSVAHLFTPTPKDSPVSTSSTCSVTPQSTASLSPRRLSMLIPPGDEEERASLAEQTIEELRIALLRTEEAAYNQQQHDHGLLRFLQMQLDEERVDAEEALARQLAQNLVSSSLTAAAHTSVVNELEQSLQKAMCTIDEQRACLHTIEQRHTCELSSKDSQLQAMNEEIDFLRQQNDDQQAHYDDAERRIADLNNQLAQGEHLLAQQSSQQQDTVINFQRQLLEQQLVHEAAVALLQNQVKQQQEAYTQLQQENTATIIELSRQRDGNETTVADLLRLLSQQQSAYAQLEQDNSIATTKLLQQERTHEATLADFEVQLSRLRSAHAQLEQTNVTLSQQRDAHEATTVDLQQQLLQHLDTQTKLEELIAVKDELAQSHGATILQLEQSKAHCEAELQAQVTLLEQQLANIDLAGISQQLQQKHETINHLEQTAQQLREQLGASQSKIEMMQVALENEQEQRETALISLKSSTNAKLNTMRAEYATQTQRIQADHADQRQQKELEIQHWRDLAKQLEAEQGSLRATIHEITNGNEAAVTQATQELVLVQEALTKAMNENDCLRQHVADLEDDKTKQSELVTVLKKKSDAQVHQLKTLSDDYAQDRQALEAQLQALEAGYEKRGAVFDSEIQATEAKFQSAMTERDVLKCQIASLEHEIQVSRANTEMKDRVDGLTTERDSLATCLQEAQAAHGRSTKEHNATLQLVHDLQADLTATHAKRDALQKRVVELEAAHEHLRSVQQDNYELHLQLRDLQALAAKAASAAATEKENSEPAPSVVTKSAISAGSTAPIKQQPPSTSTSRRLQRALGPGSAAAMAAAAAEAADGDAGPGECNQQ